MDAKRYVLIGGGGWAVCPGNPRCSVRLCLLRDVRACGKPSAAAGVPASLQRQWAGQVSDMLTCLERSAERCRAPCIADISRQPKECGILLSIYTCENEFGTLECSDSVIWGLLCHGPLLPDCSLFCNIHFNPLYRKWEKQD